MVRVMFLAWLTVLVAARGVPAAEVSGRVAMPDVCAPEVSPAVVVLEPTDGQPSVSPARPREVKLVDQRGLQFVPRVQAMSVGETLQFTNQDTETHNVHILSPGFDFNQSMAPGQPREFVPEHAGIIRLACDIHSHMRGYVVVSASPWVQVCTRLGRFRLDGVPDGRYTLTVWHEMGEPLKRDVVVQGSTVDLGTLTLTAPQLAAGAKAAPVLPWPEVIDRISVLLSLSLDAATRSGGFKKARRLAEDAYWGEFEASDMETAVRLHLGFARAGAIEAEFRALIPAVRQVAEGGSGPEPFVVQTRRVLLELNALAHDLNQKGIADRSQIFATAAKVSSSPLPAGGDRKAQLQALKKAFEHVRELADQGESEDAASAMTTAYFDQFEPLERWIGAYEPQSVRPFENEFNALRGNIGAKLKGDALAAKLAGLVTKVETALARVEGRSGGFLPAFGASLVTILREGVEVILILTMLLTLVAKTGQAGARRAIWSGTALAALASFITAAALNLLVASTRGRASALVEGGVLLAAAGVLFYVSYWLISQSESKRWTNFLKQHAAQGAEAGGLGTLMLMAFLAVYREGAETALMYQAMIDIQGYSRPGLAGLAVGLGVGLILLALIAQVIRATSVRLPLRMFFTLTGFVLFGMAVVFAGDGVAELQEAGILRVTQVGWLGDGMPVLGVYPNVQALSVQGLLVAGALLALVLTLTGGRAETSLNTPKRVAPPPAAGVGA